MSKPAHVIVLDPPVQRPSRAAVIKIEDVHKAQPMKQSHQQVLTQTSQDEPVIVDYIVSDNKTNGPIFTSTPRYPEETTVTVNGQRFDSDSGVSSGESPKRQRRPSEGSIPDLPF